MAVECEGFCGGWMRTRIRRYRDAFWDGPCIELVRHWSHHSDPRAQVMPENEA